MSEIADLNRRLRASLKKREELNSKIERIKGRHEMAKKNRDELRERCRKKGIDPDKIDESIQKLEEAYRKGVEDLEKKNKKCSEDLETFMKAAGENIEG